MSVRNDKQWIAVDWGTTSLRAWLMSADGQVLAEQANQRGMNTLQPDEFESHLLMLIDDWLNDQETTTVLVCGMAGSREGWIEAPYIEVPVALPNELTVVQAPTNDNRYQAWILPGLMQLEPPNVMRGEETQLVGFLQDYPGFSGVIGLPGTHTKWVRVKDNAVTDFTSIMTGEVFNLLSKQSILRHTLSSENWLQDAYEARFIEALETPSGFAGRLFTLRAASLVKGQPGDVSFAQLSAELIALELAAVRDNLLPDKGTPVVVIGNDHLAELYKCSLVLMGYQAQAFSGTDLSLAGLRAAYINLFQ